MRKIIMFNLMTLDGFFARPDGNIDWHNVDAEFNTFAVEQTKSFGTIIFGRTTYQMFESFWPAAINDPKMSDEDREIAQTINDIEKVVFSTTLQKLTWKNSTLYHEINPEILQELKEKPGNDIVIFGSGTVVNAIANLGLIDEYRILINPIILGSGKPLFKDIQKELKLKLFNTKTFTSGNVLLCYSPVK